MQFWLDVGSGILSTIISALLIFIVTKSEWGTNFILRIKESIKSAEDKKLSNEINEINEEKFTTKVITSRDYGEGNGFSLQTFYNIDQSILDTVDRIQFMIRDHDDLSCILKTEEIKENIANIESDGKGRIRIYLNRKSFKEDTYTIRRFGKRTLAPEEMYTLIPSDNNDGTYVFEK